jgi:uncharacterized repeat protein (TIGR01451 family)
MKKTILILFLTLPLFRILQAQSCLPDTTYFAYQGQIDAFKINNPGCKIIEGDIFISGDYITNLDSLDEIITINGNISIENNPVLSNLYGLQSLETVQKNLKISDNSKLTNLSGLDNLQNIGGTFWVSDNVLLETLTPVNFDSAGSIYIRKNNKLTNLEGLNNLEYIPNNLNIESNAALSDLSAMTNLDSIGQGFYIYGNTSMKNFYGFRNLQIIGGDFYFQSDTMQSMFGLDSLRAIRGSFEVTFSPRLSNFIGLGNVKYIGNIRHVGNDGLINFTGLNNLTTIGTYFLMYENHALTSCDGLENLVSVGDGFALIESESLSSVTGLEKLTNVGGDFRLRTSNGLSNLHGLENLTTIGGGFELNGCTFLNDISALANLHSIDGFLLVSRNNVLPNLTGLEGIITLNGSLVLSENWLLTELNGLKNLVSIGEYLQLNTNPQLINLSGFAQLSTIGNGLFIENNTLLTDCAILPICQLLNTQSNVSILNNGLNCTTAAEVEILCGGTPVEVKVLFDADCIPDNTDIALDNVQVRMEGDVQNALRATNLDGFAQFGFFENGSFLLSLPQFPTNFWAVCADNIEVIPNASGDTTKAIISVFPINPCPELSVSLGLPSNFRGCLVNSLINVEVRNSGAVIAEGVKVAVVVPPVFDIVSIDPPLAFQNGDTLFFDLGNIQYFEQLPIILTVKTRCDTFLIDQTLCIETFASMQNACPQVAIAHSDIKVSAQCLGDTLVRFMLKNIGDAPTITPHQYQIFRNQDLLSSENFSLNSQAILLKNIPADGATYRIEATKTENGLLTASAIEKCGGFTSGQITAFWLDEGEIGHDFDCRQVIGSFDPNEKTAIPSGYGDEHLMEANRPINYTIGFQNTGSDTAFRVQLRDILDDNLDLNTFQPGFASHPYTWEIRGNMLEVLFFPLMLPDSNVNEPASHGFFSFEINQKPNLPDGTTLENTAQIVFDFNPPIITNTVLHTIGRLLVAIDEPQKTKAHWEVLGNPLQTMATFKTRKQVEGAKQFELYDTLGYLVQNVKFSGQSFDFQRNRLPAGVYFFKIKEETGRFFSGKIILVD